MLKTKRDWQRSLGFGLQSPLCFRHDSKHSEPRRASVLRMRVQAEELAGRLAVQQTFAAHLTSLPCKLHLLRSHY